MSEPEVPPERLRRALREIAAVDLAEVIAEARGGARERARGLIEDLLVEELLNATIGLAARPADDPAVRTKEDADVESTPGQLWWTYCVMRAEDAAAVAPCLEGVEPGSPVEVVTHEGLAALLSAVPVAEYGDERLREHLEDLDWLERTARRHEAVLDQALRDSTLVPLRLCTLYRDLDGARRFLREHAASLVDGLARVEGCTEWGVKVFAEQRDGDGEGGPSRAEQSLGGERRGATYLMRRQRERERQQEAREVRAQCAEEVHERVAKLAREATINPPQRPEVHGREMPMLLNGAYLERDRVPELQQAVIALGDEWKAHGLLIELTGPWPPYNFVSSATGVMP